MGMNAVHLAPNMCKEFFGFRDMPFSAADDVDSSFVYLSRNYEVPLAILVSSLDKGVSLTLVLGKNGVGKTSLINYMYKQIQQDFAVGWVSDRLQSTEELLHNTLMSFGHEVKNLSVDKMLDQLRDVLSSKLEKQYQQSSLLIIDDADRMASDALKGIELLLDLNSENSLLLQIVLVGRYTLRDMLNTPNLQGVKERVGIQCSLDPFTVEETQDYINHRLDIAGGERKNLFDDQACSAVYEYSKGIPAKINSICDEALLRSSEQREYEITSALIREVAIGNSKTPTFESVETQQGLRTPISGNNKSHWFSKKSLVAGTSLVAGSIFALIFVWDRFIPRGEVRVETSHDLVKRRVGEKPLDPITDLAQVPKKTEQLESLTNKQAVDVEMPQRKAPGKITIQKSQVATKDDEVVRLLAVAEQQFRVSKLILPVKDNAYETYTAILSVSPNEKRALTGLQRIANRYLKLAKKHHTKGDWNHSQTLIARGLKVSPDHKKLANLKNQIDAGLKRQAQLDTIEILVKKAEHQVAGLKLIQPNGDNAYETYQDILNLDKSNSQARQGLQEIQRDLESQIQDALDKENFGAALHVAKEIFEIPSYGANDQYNEEAIFAAVETKKTIGYHLESLLTLAEQQSKAGRLAQPVGDNALESYRMILDIDASNKAADKGLRRLVEQYQDLIREALSNGKTGQAVAIADESLRSFPDNPDLLVLRDKAVLQRNAVLNKATKSPPQKKLKKSRRGLQPFGNF